MSCALCYAVISEDRYHEFKTEFTIHLETTGTLIEAEQKQRHLKWQQVEGAAWKVRQDERIATAEAEVASLIIAQN